MRRESFLALYPAWAKNIGADNLGVNQILWMGINAQVYGFVDADRGHCSLMRMLRLYVDYATKFALIMRCFGAYLTGWIIIPKDKLNQIKTKPCAARR